MRANKMSRFVMMVLIISLSAVNTTLAGMPMVGSQGDTASEGQGVPVEVTNDIRSDQVPNPSNQGSSCNQDSSCTQDTQGSSSFFQFQKGSGPLTPPDNAKVDAKVDAEVNEVNIGSQEVLDAWHDLNERLDNTTLAYRPAPPAGSTIVEGNGANPTASLPGLPGQNPNAQPGTTTTADIDLNEADFWEAAKNLPGNAGKSIDEFIALVTRSGPSRPGLNNRNIVVKLDGYTNDQDIATYVQREYPGYIIFAKYHVPELNDFSKIAPNSRVLGLTKPRGVPTLGQILNHAKDLAEIKVAKGPTAFNALCILFTSDVFRDRRVNVINIIKKRIKTILEFDLPGVIDSLIRPSS